MYPKGRDMQQKPEGKRLPEYLDAEHVHSLIRLADPVLKTEVFLSLGTGVGELDAQDPQPIERSQICQPFPEWVLRQVLTRIATPRELDYEIDRSQVDGR